MAEKTAAYRQVEKLTAELASAVRVAIEAESLARALCIRLEIHAGRTARNLLTDFVAWKLADAGLHDFPRPVPAMQQPLVHDES